MNPLFLAPTTLIHAPPLTFIDAASHAGYEGVGLRLNRSPGLPYYPVLGNINLVRDIKRELANSQLKVLDVLAFYLQPDSKIEQFLPALDLSAELGAQYVLVQGDDFKWSRLCESFGLFCDIAKSFKLGVAVEFVPSRPLSTLGLAIKLLSEVKQQNAVICIDPLHLMRSGGQPIDLIGLETKLFPYAQISDGYIAPGEPDLTLLGRMPLGKRCLPGHGNLPLREILATLPFNIPLSVEVLQPDQGAYSKLSAREWASLTLNASRDFLQ